MYVSGDILHHTYAVTILRMHMRTASIAQPRAKPRSPHVTYTGGPACATFARFAPLFLCPPLFLALCAAARRRPETFRFLACCVLASPAAECVQWEAWLWRSPSFILTDYCSQDIWARADAPEDLVRQGC